MLVKYGIKVELFNLRFVEMIIHCSSFFFFFTLSCQVYVWNFQCKIYTIERQMKFLNTSLILSLILY